METLSNTGFAKSLHLAFVNTGASRQPECTIDKRLPHPQPPPVCLSESVWFNSRTSSKCRCRGAGRVGRGRGHSTPLPLTLSTSPPCRFSRVRCVISQACDRPALVQGQLLKPEGEGERVLNMAREAERHQGS